MRAFVYDYIFLYNSYFYQYLMLNCGGLPPSLSSPSNAYCKTSI